ncbi:NCS1 nucleoside transporter family protein [Clavispora lusitaniae]|uniref:Uracil permease n=1 Tax=Clavispora lusitaniae (strain ATCC 42720) TaxID=306902 RepID=C4YBL0_CLAL4|nr:uncharacterized protein CLUG_05588 [Clavispora lusitaniae ATCC 42720]EEQ41460.1 hypothetical protein CLUG_05588 [Clavispora lusitaniae ATCC 42720]KAF7581057.1 NCS1 nucleoside transporter family protein [Clavispora lusitaniae]
MSSATKGYDDTFTKSESDSQSVTSVVDEKPSLWQRINKKISLQNPDLSLVQNFLINDDLKPLLNPQDRTWRWFHFIFFWISDSYNINTWQIAGTGVEAGLSWWEVWISVILGYSFVGLFIFLAQRVGAYYHVSFPVSCRASFGIFGSLWPIINRVVMAVVWASVQSWIGGQCVQLMLMSIFGADLDTKIPNKIKGSGTTSFQFLCFFLFCFFSLPAIYLKPQKLRHLFTMKAIVSPACGIALLIWTIKRAGGIGPVVHQKTSVSGSTHAWAFINSTMNCIANFATLTLNAPDFSRLAKTRHSSSWTQAISIPLSFALTAIIGILVSSASKVMYGTAYWSPLDVMKEYVISYTSGDRGGVFIIALGFAIAQLGTNISANYISAGTDMAALLPQYINIRRGGFIAAAICFTICPWHFFSSSKNFTTYLSAYAVFLSAITGVIASDYFWVRRGYLNVWHLYSFTPESNYAYNSLGVNWRAYVAYICGILPNIVGFVGACGVSIPIGAQYIYNLSYFAGYIVSFTIYALLCFFWPVKGAPVKDIREKGWYEVYVEDRPGEKFSDIVSGKLEENEYVRARGGIRLL